MNKKIIFFAIINDNNSRHNAAAYKGLKDPDRMKCFIMDSNELNDRSVFERTISILPEERRSKVMSYVFQKDRNLSICAGLFMEYIKKKYGTEIVLGRNDKPISKEGKVEFNISHSGHYTVCATSESSIGIDIEMIADNDDISPTVMRDEEYSIYMKWDEGDRAVLFCRMWTAKESYMKAIGSGLTLSPKAFSVICQNGIDDSNFPEGFRIYELMPPEGYCISVCSKEDSFMEPEYITCSEMYDLITKMMK